MGKLASSSARRYLRGPGPLAGRFGGEAAFQKTLDLYVDLILPKLAGAPKSQLQLGVPRYALDALQREGLAFVRTTRVGAIGIHVWHRTGDVPIEASRDWATMTFFEGLK